MTRPDDSNCLLPSVFRKWPVWSIFIPSSIFFRNHPYYWLLLRNAEYFPKMTRPIYFRCLFSSHFPKWPVLSMLIAYCRVFSRRDPSDIFALPSAFSRNDPFYLYLLPTAVYFPGNYLSCRLKWPILLTRTEFEMTHLIDSDVVWNVPHYWLGMQTVRFPRNDSLLAVCCCCLLCFCFVFSRIRPTLLTEHFPGNGPPYWLSIFQEMTHIIDVVFLFRGNYPLYWQPVFPEMFHITAYFARNAPLYFFYFFYKSGNDPLYWLCSEKCPILLTVSPEMTHLTDWIFSQKKKKEKKK